MRPERIVSLCPSNTEILFALGLVESIVGVDSHSDYPTQVKELPRVGPDLRINMEKVKALEPDLVVASLTVPGMERNIEALENKKHSKFYKTSSTKNPIQAQIVLGMVA